jgi:hypothetical protein
MTSQTEKVEKIGFIMLIIGLALLPVTLIVFSPLCFICAVIIGLGGGMLCMPDVFDGTYKKEN